MRPKSDATWFSPLDADRIVVAHPGPSLCALAHGHPDPVARSRPNRPGGLDDRAAENAGFLFDWFHKTTLLPTDMELWWVGKLGLGAIAGRSQANGLSAQWTSGAISE